MAIQLLERPRSYSWQDITDREAHQIFRSIKKIEADGDWDGISAAVQIKRHYPDSEVTVSLVKNILETDTTTLVLDKTTSGDGWVIDHHPRDSMPRNIFAFSPDGTVPTSTLTYRRLPIKDDTDLLISATAEITEGLHTYGEKSGSLSKLFSKYPYYANPSTVPNQFGVDKEIYLIADVLILLSNIDPEAALRVGRKLSPEVKTAEDLIKLCDEKHQSTIRQYMDFIANYSGYGFEEIYVGSHKAKVADSKTFEFPMPALSKKMTTEPGDYIFLKENRISVRTNDPEFLEAVLDRLKPHVKDYGGRVGWYGILLDHEMEYNTLVKMLTTSNVELIFSLMRAA